MASFSRVIHARRGLSRQLCFPPPLRRGRRRIPSVSGKGDDDSKPYDGTVELYLGLRRRGLIPELRVGDGGHDWKYWRSMVEAVFVFFDGAFRAAE